MFVCSSSLVIHCFADDTKWNIDLLVLFDKQIIAVLGSHIDNNKMLLRYWMPYIPFSLLDLLVSPSFSPHPLVSLSFRANTSSPSPKETRFTLLAKSMAYQILSALAYLHDAARGGGIAHRDVKPSNILLNGDGCVKLIDFGVAWKAEDECEDAKSKDLWPEEDGRMYFEVATGYVYFYLPV